MSLLRLLPAVVVLAGCMTGSGLQPSADVTTASPAWVHRFQVDWTQEMEASGTRKVTGYVRNISGDDVYDVQLLAQALDASGGVVGQRISWGGSMAGFSRAYFVVRDLPAAQSYRVTVWNFTVLQSEGWD